MDILYSLVLLFLLFVYGHAIDYKRRDRKVLLCHPIILQAGLTLVR